jgi:acetyl-CoA synthetase
VLYEGTPDTPHQGRWWEIIADYGVTLFYTAPTAIRTCMKWGEQIPAGFELSSLRVLGSVWSTTTAARSATGRAATWW